MNLRYRSILQDHVPVVAQREFILFRTFARRLRGVRANSLASAPGRHRRPAHVRLTAGAAAVATLVSVSAWIAISERTASGAATPAGTIAKTGVDVTTPSTTTVTGGDTVKY